MHNCDLVNACGYAPERHRGSAGSCRSERPHSFSTACNIATQNYSSGRVKPVQQRHSPSHSRISHRLSMFHVRRYATMCSEKARLNRQKADGRRAEHPCREKTPRQSGEKRRADHTVSGSHAPLPANGRLRSLLYSCTSEKRRTAGRKKDLRRKSSERCYSEDAGVKDEKGVWIIPAFQKLLRA